MRSCIRLLAVGAMLLAGLLADTSPAGAQDLDRRIRANQARLDSIRREREQLESELNRLRGRARDISSEISLIERQKTITSRVVNELDRQMAAMTSQLDTITMDLMLAQDALAETNAVLQRRLAQIYKRGGLWAFQVLLAAESFGDLLSRYKYLHLVSRQDRAMAGEMEDLRDRITAQRGQQVSARNAIEAQRVERGDELERYVRLERRRQNTLRQMQASQRAAVSRIDSLAAAEDALNQLINSLVTERRRAIERGVPVDAAGTISPEDVGTLRWPVEGQVVYEWGRVTRPDGTSIRRNGVGIAVPEGTPVRAVASGTVVGASAMLTYGPSIIIDHGGGFYTLYLYLSSFDVRPNQVVSAGQVIGRSGGRASDAGPHIEFQIRQDRITLNPLNWLVPARR
jgi:septal ring factor EnvC (AmiA/AmiB activator)